MAKMVIVNCKCCGAPFWAREADRKRGWGRFCSKSCKAKRQEARTGQFAARQFCAEQSFYTGFRSDES